MKRLALLLLLPLAALGQQYGPTTFSCVGRNDGSNIAYAVVPSGYKVTSLFWHCDNAAAILTLDWVTNTYQISNALASASIGSNIQTTVGLGAVPNGTVVLIESLTNRTVQRALVITNLAGGIVISNQSGSNYAVNLSPLAAGDRVHACTSVQVGLLDTNPGEDYTLPVSWTGFPLLPAGGIQPAAFTLSLAPGLNVTQCVVSAFGVR